MRIKNLKGRIIKIKIMTKTKVKTMRMKK
jgi:hypothetical protein